MATVQELTEKLNTIRTEMMNSKNDIETYINDSVSTRNEMETAINTMIQKIDAAKAAIEALKKEEDNAKLALQEAKTAVEAFTTKVENLNINNLNVMVETIKTKAIDAENTKKELETEIARVKAEANAAAAAIT
jgi:chromosome segregation ATPase